MIDLDKKDQDSNQQDQDSTHKTRWILLVIPRGRSSLHDTDCNYVDDHAADVEDVGYPIRTGSFGDRETLVGRCHVLLLPTKRVCGSVGDLDRNVVRRVERR